MRTLFEFLFTRKHALIGFLLLKTIAVIINGMVQASAEVWAVGILALVVYGIIARFAQAGRAISIWASFQVKVSALCSQRPAFHR